MKKEKLLGGISGVRRAPESSRELPPSQHHADHDIQEGFHWDWSKSADFQPFRLELALKARKRGDTHNEIVEIARKNKPTN